MDGFFNKTVTFGLWSLLILGVLPSLAAHAPSENLVDGFQKKKDGAVYSASPVGKRGYNVQLAFDGKEDTKYEASKVGPGAWIQAAYARPKKYDGIIIRHPTESGVGVARELVVQIRKGKRWKTIVSVQESFTNVIKLRFRETSARIWRVRADRIVWGSTSWMPSEIEFQRLGKGNFETEPDAIVAQKKINKAIDDGQAFLLKKLKTDGHFPSGFRERYPLGVKALGALALRKSGLTRKDPLLLDMANQMSRMSLDRTYSVGLYAMFLRSMSKSKYASRMQDIADWISSHQRGEGLWAYPTGKADLSCTQFALLGLKAATEGGAKVEPKVWRKSLDWFLKNAEKSGGYRYEPLRLAKNDPTTGSMTAAALACMKICVDHLPGDKGRSRTWKKVSDTALAWLGKRFVVEMNPGKGSRHYYYLYGIERVGAFYKIRRIGGKLWYATGARHLLKFQLKNGAWKNSYFEETCYALLFLNRASTTGE